MAKRSHESFGLVPHHTNQNPMKSKIQCPHSILRTCLAQEFGLVLVLPFRWEWETGMHGCQPGWEVLCIDIIHYKTHKHVIQLKDQSHIKHFDVENGKCWHTLQTWNIIELNWFSSEKDRKQVEKESRHLPWDEAGQRETIFSRKISNDLSLFVTIRILLNAMSLDQVIQ